MARHEQDENGLLVKPHIHNEWELTSDVVPLQATLFESLQSLINQEHVFVEEQVVNITKSRESKIMDSPMLRMRKHKSLNHKMRRRSGDDGDSGTKNELKAIDDDDDDDDGDNVDGSCVYTGSNIIIVMMLI